MNSSYSGKQFIVVENTCWREAYFSLWSHVACSVASQPHCLAAPSAEEHRPSQATWDEPCAGEHISDDALSRRGYAQSASRNCNDESCPGEPSRDEMFESTCHAASAVVSDTAAGSSLPPLGLEKCNCNLVTSPDGSTRDVPCKSSKDKRDEFDNAVLEHLCIQHFSSGNDALAVDWNDNIELSNVHTSDFQDAVNQNIVVNMRSPLKIGDEIEIHGLQGAKELNGRKGRLVSFVEATQRFGVAVDGERENKALKPINLHKVVTDHDTAKRAELEAKQTQAVQIGLTKQTDLADHHDFALDYKHIASHLKNVTHIDVDSDPSEELEPLPQHLKSQDPWLGARIEKEYDGTYYSGTVLDIEVTKFTNERLYFIRYDDNDCEHLTAQELRQYHTSLATRKQ